MRIGFTGTQVGMTNLQKDKVSDLFNELNVTEFHHGDCTGADEEAHNIVTKYFYKLLDFTQFRGKIVIHPPSNPKKRAQCKAREIKAPKPYIERNHDIVDETQTLIGTPKEYEEQLRSGTWVTIRYGKKRGKKVYIVYPNGEVTIFN